MNTRTPPVPELREVGRLRNGTPLLWWSTATGARWPGQLIQGTTVPTLTVHEPTGLLINEATKRKLEALDPRTDAALSKATRPHRGSPWVTLGEAIPTDTDGANRG